MNDAREPEVLTVRLDPATLDDLAHHVADLVGHQLANAIVVGTDEPPEPRGRLLSAAEVAERWGVERAWIYAHAEQLGALRLGTGKKPRLRFKADRVAAYLDRDEPALAPPADTPAARRAGSVRR
jgi:hypothetical protein